MTYLFPAVTLNTVVFMMGAAPMDLNRTTTAKSVSNLSYITVPRMNGVRRVAGALIERALLIGGAQHRVGQRSTAHPSTCLSACSAPARRARSVGSLLMQRATRILSPSALIHLLRCGVYEVLGLLRAIRLNSAETVSRGAVVCADIDNQPRTYRLLLVHREGEGT